jgi:hypothetical protein
LPKPSTAVTVKLPGTPAVTGVENPLTASTGWTATAVLPTTPPVPVAVTVWLPALFRVTPLKVCAPLSAFVKV